MSTPRKTQVVFPDDLLREVDRLVGGRKRSDFVVEATREKLARVRFQETLGRASGTWTAARHPETRSQAALTRWLGRARKETRKRLGATPND